MSNSSKPVALEAADKEASLVIAGGQAVKLQRCRTNSVRVRAEREKAIELGEGNLHLGHKQRARSRHGRVTPPNTRPAREGKNDKLPWKNDRLPLDRRRHGAETRTLPGPTRRPRTGTSPVGKTNAWPQLDAGTRSTRRRA